MLISQDFGAKSREVNALPCSYLVNNLLINPYLSTVAPPSRPSSTSYEQFINKFSTGRPHLCTGCRAGRSRPATPRPACPAPLPLACPSRFLPLAFFCLGTGTPQTWNGTSQNTTQAGTRKNRRAGAGRGGHWHTCLRYCKHSHRTKKGNTIFATA